MKVFFNTLFHGDKKTKILLWGCVIAGIAMVACLVMFIVTLKMPWIFGTIFCLLIPLIILRKYDFSDGSTGSDAPVIPGNPASSDKKETPAAPAVNRPRLSAELLRDAEEAAKVLPVKHPEIVKTPEEPQKPEESGKPEKRKKTEKKEKKVKPEKADKPARKKLFAKKEKPEKPVKEKKPKAEKPVKEKKEKVKEPKPEKVKEPKQEKVKQPKPEKPEVKTPETPKAQNPEKPVMPVKPQEPKPEKTQPEKKVTEPQEEKTEKQPEKKQSAEPSEPALLDVDQKEMKQIMVKYKVKREHKPVIIDSSEKHNISHCPAYIWVFRKRLHLLLLEQTPRELSFDLARCSKLTFSRVSGNAATEYADIRTNRLLSSIFSQCIPIYHDDIVDHRRASFKNLYTLVDDIKLTNTSARAAFDLTKAAFELPDKYNLPNTAGQYVREANKTKILWQDGVIVTSEFKTRIKNLLEDMTHADISDREFDMNLHEMVSRQLITKEYADYYGNAR